MQKQNKKRILAIGGHVIKTSRTRLRRIIEDEKIEMLIHNGGSLFHDFQLSIDMNLLMSGDHSYKLETLIEDPSVNKRASKYVWDWIDNGIAPQNSLTRLCEDKSIPVLMFTIPGADFWHMFEDGDHWALLGRKTYDYFTILRERFKKSFHYLCMGSAVIHPEVFTKAISGINKPDFQADVVDFLDMYRPKTRISKYGKYYKMTHEDYFKLWTKEKL